MIGTTMRVARLHGPGDVRVHEEPPPEPGPGERLVQVTSVGLCGSDLRWAAAREGLKVVVHPA